MNFRWFFVALTIAFAAGGGLLWYESTRPPDGSLGLSENESPRHPVTEQMLLDTAAQTSKSLPRFTLPTTDDLEYKIGQPNGKKAQLVYFVKDGCPCSFDAEPFFKELGRRFRNTVDFVCITNAVRAKAKDWAGRQAPPYAVAYDPDQKVIKAYKAKHSVYTLLLNQRGEIIKMWPGYSKGILTEMNSELAKAAGVKESKFDPKYAPDTKTSGCDFSED